MILIGLWQCSGGGDRGSTRKIHWLSWDKLCVPKSEGGLGF